MSQTAQTVEDIHIGNMYYMYTQVSMALIESEGEITPEIQEWIDKLEQALPEKLDTMAGMLAYLKGQVEYLKTERQRIASREHSFGRGIEQIREQMLELMDLVGEQKVKTAMHTISRRTTESWAINDDLFSNGDLDELVERGLATRINDYKADMTGIKAFYRDYMRDDLPEYITVTEKESITIR